MISSSFNEENALLDSPQGMTPDQCSPLPVFKGYLPSGYPILISCWKVTQEEIVEIQRTGRVWLAIMGHGMPPVLLTATKPDMESSDVSR